MDNKIEYIRHSHHTKEEYDIIKGIIKALIDGKILVKYCVIKHKYVIIENYVNELSKNISFSKSKLEFIELMNKYLSFFKYNLCIKYFLTPRYWYIPLKIVKKEFTSEGIGYIFSYIDISCENKIFFDNITKNNKYLNIVDENIHVSNGINLCNSTFKLPFNICEDKIYYLDAYDILKKYFNVNLVKIIMGYFFF